MLELAAAILVFLGLHSAPRATGLREVGVARFGRGSYLAIYSTASLLSLAWVISATLRAPYVALWSAGSVGVWAAAIGTALACWLWVSGASRPNPLSIAFRAGAGASGASVGGALAWSRHPILLGFLTWSLGHLAANGDVASLVFFGGSAVFAIGGMAMMDARAKRTLGASAWAAAAERPDLRGRLRALVEPAAIAEIAVAALAFAALLHAHPWLFGVAPLAAL